MHISVLAKEAIEGLRIRPGSTILDGTVGGGGHSRMICELVGERGKLFGIDLDADALERGRAATEALPCSAEFLEGNFRDMEKLLGEKGTSSVDGILLDLGLSSFQLEGSGRGFSFQRDEPLLMTFGKSPSGLTAFEIVNSWNRDDIARILYEYAEEHASYRIADAIVERRRTRPIESAEDLAETILVSMPRRGRVHPATKTFQALRMAVNDELDALRDALGSAWNLLKSEGRLAVISFHSLEDRIVKEFMRSKSQEGVGTLVTKKPITPERQEILENPRSRSAKLRIIEKK